LFGTLLKNFSSCCFKLFKYGFNTTDTDKAQQIAHSNDGASTSCSTSSSKSKSSYFVCLSPSSGVLDWLFGSLTLDEVLLHVLKVQRTVSVRVQQRWQKVLRRLLYLVDESVQLPPLGQLAQQLSLLCEQDTDDPNLMADLQLLLSEEASTKMEIEYGAEGPSLGDVSSRLGQRLHSRLLYREIELRYKLDARLAGKSAQVQDRLDSLQPVLRFNLATLGHHLLAIVTKCIQTTANAILQLAGVINNAIKYSFNMVTTMVVDVGRYVGVVAMLRYLSGLVVWINQRVVEPVAAQIKERWIALDYSLCSLYSTVVQIVTQLFTLVCSQILNLPILLLPNYVYQLVSNLPSILRSPIARNDAQILAISIQQVLLASTHFIFWNPFKVLIAGTNATNKPDQPGQPTQPDQPTQAGASELNEPRCGRR